jgi:hypothetical protein
MTALLSHLNLFARPLLKTRASAISETVIHDVENEKSMRHASTKCLASYFLVDVDYTVRFNVPDTKDILQEELPFYIGADTAWTIAMRSLELYNLILKKIPNDHVKQDAVRHASWAAWISMTFGESVAKTATDAHEASGKVDKYFAFDSTMDIHNNSIGLLEWRAIHVVDPSATLSLDQLVDKMMPHYSDGHLWIWWPKTNNSNESDGMLRLSNGGKIR